MRPEASWAGLICRTLYTARPPPVTTNTVPWRGTVAVTIHVNPLTEWRVLTNLILSYCRLMVIWWAASKSAMLETNGRSLDAVLQRQQQTAISYGCAFSCEHRSPDVAVVRCISANTLASPTLAAAAAAAAIAAPRCSIQMTTTVCAICRHWCRAAVGTPSRLRKWPRLREAEWGQNGHGRVDV